MAQGFEPVPNGKISQSSYVLKLTTDDIQVVSSIPGRTRLKISRPHWDYRKLQQIASVFKAHEKVYDVRVNANCGSIVVLYHQTNVSDLDTLSGLLYVQTRVHKIKTDFREPSEKLTDTIANSNKPEKQATYIKVELLLLILLGLAALGIWQLVCKELQIEPTSRRAPF